MTYGGTPEQPRQGEMPPSGSQPTQPMPYGTPPAYPQPPSFGHSSYGQPVGYGRPQPYGQPVSYGQPVHGGPVPFDQPPPGTPYVAYVQPVMAPYGPVPVDPYTGRPISPKSKAAAGLLQIFLGTLGIGRFYMGSTTIGVIQLVGTIVGWATSWLLIGIPILIGVAVWSVIDGIVILAGRPVDEHGRELR